MFSVVVPVYNHERYLEQALLSALSSRLVGEILVVDDGSADRSPEMLRRLSRAFAPRIVDLTVKGEGNKGAHYRLNQLIEAARGEWIAVLNSDDEFVSSRFDVLRSLIRANRSDFISGALLIQDHVGGLIGTKQGIASPEYPLSIRFNDTSTLFTSEMLVLLCNQNFIATTSNMTFRTSLFRRVGGFRDFRYVHDWDFALRACAAGQCLFTHHPLTIYRSHLANTIKETSSHADGEVVRLFANFLDDFPALESDARVRAALCENRHLGQYREPLRSSQPSTGRQSPGVVIDTRVASEAGLAPDTQLWTPAEERQLLHLPVHGRRLPARALNNAVMALSVAGYDFVLVSETLEEPPIVAVSSVSDNVLMNRRAYGALIQGTTPDYPLRGRVIRHVPQLDDKTKVTQLTNLPGFQEARVLGAVITIPDLSTGLDLAGSPQSEIDFPMPLRTGDKPFCMVLPIFLAVGGVERNMIEVLRILKDEYDFAVVTSERLAKHQGSLHHQVDELGIPIFDLAEAAEPDEHLFLVDLLKRHFRPNLVWICNGSPWLADNADRIRRVFANIPIVDQQVYDTEHGWINRYRERGIQSFDRFIATTRKIMDKFEVDIGIPRNRIDLIYSSIDSERLKGKEGTPELERALRSEAGMPLDVRIYAFIGRLTPQKRPLEFLELARQTASHEFQDRFLLVGDGELRHACEHYIVREGLKNVTTIRYCEDLSGIVNMIDGLIVTSEFEALPIALLETLALGRPALATDVGDIGVILNEHGNGMVVPLAGGAEALWEGFQRWRESLPLYRRNAQTHAAAIRERFSNLKIAAEYRASWVAAIEQVRREKSSASTERKASIPRRSRGL